MYAISRGTPYHAIIVNNIGAELRQALQKTPSRVATSDLRIRSARSGFYADGQRHTVLNPRPIAEVLSKSTETFLRLANGEWLLAKYSGFDALSICKSIDCTLPPAQIYDQVPLDPKPGGCPPLT
jgi:hypothetical protein